MLIPANAIYLLAACLALVLLTFAVGVRLLVCRVQEMREKRVHPQTVATSLQMVARLENVQAADNFRNLFETPVLFYVLATIALAMAYTPLWLVIGAWLYVALRVLHSLIQCTYNKVMHRFRVFLASFALLTILWVAFFVSLLARATP